MKITGLVHTRDSADTLEATLASLEWVDERLVVDMASRDATREIAARYGFRVLEAPVTARVDDVRNRFLELVRHPWVLVLDSDEHLAEDAPGQVERLVHEHGEAYDAFAIPRYNYIGERLLRGTGWYPDPQVRLFRQGTVEWADGFHRVPRVRTGPARLLTLEPPSCLHIHHRNYRDLDDFLRRQLRYALEDVYPEDPEGFDFGAYVAAAYDEFARRTRDEGDGDLGHALATLMAWDRVVRGLVHWERLGRRPELAPAFSLPVHTTREPLPGGVPLAEWEDREALRRSCQALRGERDRLAAELAKIDSSPVWRGYVWLRGGFPRLFSLLAGVRSRIRAPAPSP